MKLPSGQTAILGITLLACLLVASLPSRVLRLNLCDCGGISLELASAQTEDCECPSEALPEEQAGDCCAIPCCDSDEPEPAPEDEDPCCDDLPVPLLLSSSSDTHPQWSDAQDFVFAPAAIPSAAITSWLRDLSPCATGPPLRPHHLRRGLLERRAIVLLI